MSTTFSLQWVRCAAMTALVVVSLTGPCRAGESAPAPSAAQVRYREAERAIKAKDWPEARRLLLELWLRSKSYDVAAMLGQAEYGLQHYGAAARCFAFALQNVPPSASPSLTAGLRDALDELKPFVSKLTMVVDRPGVELRIDGEVIDASGVPVVTYVEPGLHRIEAAAEGGAARTELSTTAGETYEVKLTLAPNGGAGVSRPSEPLVPAASAPPASRDVPTSAGARKQNLVRALFAGSAAIVALGTGVGLTLASNAKESEKDDVLDSLEGESKCGRGTPHVSACAHVRELDDQAGTLRTVGYVAFGVGAVAAVTTVYFLAVPPSRAVRSTAATFAVEPMAGGGARGLSLSAQF